MAGPNMGTPEELLAAIQQIMQGGGQLARESGFPGTESFAGGAGPAPAGPDLGVLEQAGVLAELMQKGANDYGPAANFGLGATGPPNAELMGQRGEAGLQRAAGGLQESMRQPPGPGAGVGIGRTASSAPMPGAGPAPGAMPSGMDSAFQQAVMRSTDPPAHDIQPVMRSGEPQGIDQMLAAVVPAGIDTAPAGRASAGIDTAPAGAAPKAAPDFRKRGGEYDYLAEKWNELKHKHGLNPDHPQPGTPGAGEYGSGQGDQYNLNSMKAANEFTPAQIEHTKDTRAQTRHEEDMGRRRAKTEEYKEGVRIRNDDPNFFGEKTGSTEAGDLSFKHGETVYAGATGEALAKFANGGELSEWEVNAFKEAPGAAQVAANKQRKSGRLAEQARPSETEMAGGNTLLDEMRGAAPQPTAGYVQPDEIKRQWMEKNRGSMPDDLLEIEGERVRKDVYRNLGRADRLSALDKQAGGEGLDIPRTYNAREDIEGRRAAGEEYFQDKFGKSQKRVQRESRQRRASAKREKDDRTTRYKNMRAMDPIAREAYRMQEMGMPESTVNNYLSAAMSERSSGGGKGGGGGGGGGAGYGLSAKDAAMIGLSRDELAYKRSEGSAGRELQREIAGMGQADRAADRSSADFRFKQQMGMSQKEFEASQTWREKDYKQKAEALHAEGKHREAVMMEQKLDREFRQGMDSLNQKRANADTQLKRDQLDAQIEKNWLDHAAQVENLDLSKTENRLDAMATLLEHYNTQAQLYAESDPPKSKKYAGYAEDLAKDIHQVSEDGGKGAVETELEGGK